MKEIKNQCLKVIGLARLPSNKYLVFLSYKSVTLF